MDNRVERIPHIGIVAGTAEGAALCYRTLCQEAESVMGHRYAHPEITLHSFSLHRYLDAIDQDVAIRRIGEAFLEASRSCPE